MIFLYYAFVFVYWLPRVESSFGADAYFGLFHLTMFMFIWSFITTIFTDPGQVPLYWVRDLTPIALVSD